jgi:uncharacterized protein (DUF1800 family)
MPNNRSADAAAAANRFGLGAKPGTLQSLGDPRDALAQSIHGLESTNGMRSTASAFAGLPSSVEYLASEYQFLLQRRERKQALNATGATQADSAQPDSTQVDSGRPARRNRRQFLQAAVAAPDDAPQPNDLQAQQQRSPAPGGGFRKQFGAQLLAEMGARWQVALAAPIGFDERLVRFWSNHFAVSVDKRQALLYAAPMEREVIRPLAFGRFADLLLGVETHPAMLRYLDNVKSIGPDSRVGERVAEMGSRGRASKREAGLNENLAREILELHTLGVNGGYSQADVTEFARAITGWSLRGPRDRGAFSNDNAFVFRDNAHEPGARTVLGKRYADGGVEQGRRILADLALNPATAKHLSFKLARHFVSDQPAPTLVERMAKRYLDTGGSLSALYLAMLQSDEAWSPDARKFRTPDDFLLAGLRVLGTQTIAQPQQISGLLGKLGQASFMPRSPAGFADTADAWIGPDALYKRIQTADALAARAPRSLDPNRVAQDALGVHLGHATAQTIQRADSPHQALALLLASPDFQWRI